MGAAIEPPFPAKPPTCVAVGPPFPARPPTCVAIDPPFPARLGGGDGSRRMMWDEVLQKRVSTSIERQSKLHLQGRWVWNGHLGSDRR